MSVGVNRQDCHRPAFTLLELLIVIAIIAIVGSLTAGAAARIYFTQDQKRTETTIIKLDSELKRRWQSVIDQASLEAIPDTYRLRIINDLAGQDESRVRVIWIKLRLKQQFPMSFAEALNPTPTAGPYIPPEAAYTRILGQAGINSDNPAKWPPASYESSACLAMSLMVSRNGMDTNLEDHGNSVAILSPDNFYPYPQYNLSALKYFVDGWGHSLGFYRWPTGWPEVDKLFLNKPGQTTANRDAQDRDGKLMDSNWWNNPNYRTNFTAIIHALPVDPTSPATPHSYYLIPAIVSPGLDNRLGFGPPSPWPLVGPDPMYAYDPDATSDNIYNFRLTLGGRGD